jgi:hypothetical protein
MANSDNFAQETVMGDSQLEVQNQLGYLQISEEEVECDYVDPSLYKLRGAIIQFENSNCTGATAHLGCVRIAEEDIRQVPAYLEIYEEQIKRAALELLNRHFNRNQCAVGMGEDLELEDFGLSFAIASLSADGLSLNPHKKEGPLSYCLLPGFIQARTVAIFPDQSRDMAHVIHAYIHLLPSTQRYCALKRKLLEAPIKPAKDKDGSSKPSGPRAQTQKRPYQGNTITRSRSPLVKAKELAKINAELKDNMSNLGKKIARLEGAALPSPALPTSNVRRTWPAKHKGVFDLPK